MYADKYIYCRRATNNPGYRELTKDFNIDGNVIKSGYLWDGASAPWIAKRIIPRFDHSLIASVLHDYLCSKSKNKNDRFEADKRFRTALIDLEEFSIVRANLAYAGVRTGAWWGTGVRYPHFIKDHIWPLVGVK